MIISYPQGSKVRIKTPTLVPDWSVWDDDKGRCSASVKKKLRQDFYMKNIKLSVETVYIAKETEREKLRKLNRTKVRIRHPNGSSIVLIVDLENLEKA